MSGNGLETLDLLHLDAHSLEDLIASGALASQADMGLATLLRDMPPQAVMATIEAGQASGFTIEVSHSVLELLGLA